MSRVLTCRAYWITPSELLGKWWWGKGGEEKGGGGGEERRGGEREGGGKEMILKGVIWIY